MSKPWKKMTDAEKAKMREYWRKYRQTPKAKAAQRERKRRWNAKNRDRKNAYNREWYARHKGDPSWMADKIAVKMEWQMKNAERYREMQKKRYASFHRRNPDYRRTYMAMWRALNPERNAEYQKAYRARHRDRIRASRKAYRLTHDTWMMRKLVFARDPQKYARYRELNRAWYAKKKARAGKTYTPNMSRRIPDWMPYGVSAAVAARSVFVWETHGKERQRELNGYARDLAIERRAK